MMTDLVQPINPNKSLVLASIELGRALADRDGVLFRAQGTCMYPTVRPGDVLRIQSRAVADIAAGDIAVCRRQNHLFGHRVIDKGEVNGRAFIETRPDRALTGGDGPTFDENVLGIVVAIERNGKLVPPQPATHPGLVRRHYAALLALVEAVQSLRTRLTDVFVSVQDNTHYRLIARAWLAASHPSMSFIVRVPLNTKLGDAVYHRLKPDEFDLRTMYKGRAVKRWTLAVHLNDARLPAAWLTMARATGGEAFVESTSVRIRYRGTGLEKVLLQQMDKIFARCG